MLVCVLTAVVPKLLFLQSVLLFSSTCTRVTSTWQKYMPWTYPMECRSKMGKANKPVAQSKSERDAAKRREQMAAAAEARMARLQLASQQQQLWS